MGIGQFLRQQYLYNPLPYHITSVSRFNAIPQMLPMQTNGGIGSVAWLGNNVAVYSPISIPAKFIVARFMVANGNATGNIDVGLYSSGGTRLMSTGTQSRTGAAQIQYYAVTDQSFPAGNYYLALVCSTTTGAVYTSNVGNLNPLRGCGFLQETLGSTVLPTSMTPVAYTSTQAWQFGFSQSDTY